MSPDRPRAAPARGALRLAVAGLSARLLADAAQAEGHAVLALDLYGDADTRRAALGWRPLGALAGERFDAAALCAGLRAAAQAGATGWLAGSGFEAQPELLDVGARELPLWGLGTAALGRLRDPQQFFAVLDAHGVPHPEVAFRLPAGPAAGWLVKHGQACGGGHVRPLRPDEPVLPPHAYLQRFAPGQPMSATFLADGRAAQVLGINRLAVAGQGPKPWRFVGATGPVAVPSAVADALARALAVLVPAFGLRGLGSLDALVDGDRVAVLEINARPPATVALYGHQRPISGHIAAWAGAADPAAPAAAATPTLTPPVRGFETLYARRAGVVDAALAHALAALEGCHDLPHTGDRLCPGAPVCTVSAESADEAAVHRLLGLRRAHVHHLLETHAP
jgi:predicted ATP-grasp superfamily ATP-dependent carboligase